MIPLSARELLPFTPVEGGATYHIAVPTILQRHAYRRDVVAAGARYPSDKDLLEILRAGIRAVVRDDAQGPLIDLVDNYEAVSGDPQKLADDPDLLKDIAEIEETIAKHYPAYAEAQADRTYWLGVAPIIAFKHFVRGWDGLDTAYTARGGRVADECLEQVPEADVLAVGWKILGLMNPSLAQEKNSESRSPSPHGRETSTAA